MRPRRAGGQRDAGGRPLRFGAAIEGRVERGLRLHPVPGQKSIKLCAPHHAAVDLVGDKVLRPAFVVGDGAVGRGGEEDAGPAVSHAMAGARLEPFPGADRLDHQGDFAGVAARQPHPAPVARGLFGPDFALFAERDADAPLRQFQRGRGADDAAADDDDIDAAGQSAVFGEGIGFRAGHGATLPFIPDRRTRNLAS